jgi:hypothetical protein
MRAPVENIGHSARQDGKVYFRIHHLTEMKFLLAKGASNVLSSFIMDGVEKLPLSFWLTLIM